MITLLLSIMAGALSGKYIFAPSVIWFLERKWGKHYRISFTNYDGKPDVIHIWSKRDDLVPTYALMIQEANNIVKKGVEDELTKFERVRGE